MEVINQERLEFYSVDPANGKIRISHFQVLAVLGLAGYCRAKISNHSHTLVRETNNTIVEVNEADLINYLKNYLMQSTPPEEVVESFVKGIGTFINRKKLQLLQETELADDKDGKDYSQFYFQNKILKVFKDRIETVQYSQLSKTIWENRIIPFSIEDRPNEKGDFESFCMNISSNNEEKFERLKSIIGYLLHRYKNPSQSKAIILYDEKMNESSLAEGGTGKSLISRAIGECREVVVFNGKKLKESSQFQYQRIDITTDVLSYDDVQKNFKFSSIFPLLTSPIEIEKKGKDAFELSNSETPKVLISSNTYVKGPGGSSDRRRRCEFELANHYSDKFSPIDEFGKNFFDDWNEHEWNQFFYFMFDCVQTFLSNGLICGNKEKERETRLKNLTSEKFLDVITNFSEINSRNDQRVFLEILNEEGEGLSPHMFTKWCKIYCDEMGYKFEKENTGGNYYFKFITK